MELLPSIKSTVWCILYLDMLSLINPATTHQSKRVATKVTKPKSQTIHIWDVFYRTQIYCRLSAHFEKNISKKPQKIPDREKYEHEKNNPIN